MKSKRIFHRIYKVKHAGRIFYIDGQNHEFDSKEWQLFEVTDNGEQWIETYPTKRDAMADIPTWCK